MRDEKNAGDDRFVKERAEHVRGRPVRDLLVGLCLGRLWPDDAAHLVMGDHEESADDQRHATEAGEKSDVEQFQTRASERDQHEVDRHHRKRDPGADEVTLSCADDGHDQRREDQLRLCPKKLVEQKVAASKRRRKEKGDLGFAELHAAGIFRKGPGGDHHQQHDDADNVGDEWFVREVAAAQHVRVSLRVAHVEEPEVGGAGDGSDEIARLAQPAETLKHPVLEREQRDPDKRPGHASGRLLGGDPEECFFQREVVAAFGDLELQVRDRVVGDARSVLDDGHRVAELFDQVQKVRAEDDGRAGLRAADDRFLHPADAQRVEAGERLVEDQHIGLVDEAAGDHQFLFHAARELGRQ